MTPTSKRPGRRTAAPPPAVTGPRAADDGVELRPVPPAQAERIAPFVAWLATQDLAETVRREHREAVEAYMTWCHSDEGPTSGRRRRYEHHLDRSAPQLLATARAGLDRFAQYRELVARTLPIDHH